MWKKEYKSRFTPSGRIGRKDFLKNFLFLMGSSILLELIIFASGGSLLSSEINGIASKMMVCNLIIAIIYLFILMYTGLCLTAKRTHDLGFRLWWLCLLNLGYPLVMALVNLLLLKFIKSFFVLTIIGFVLYFVLFGLIIYLLFFKKGQAHANKFGDVV